MPAAFWHFMVMNFILSNQCNHTPYCPKRGSHRWYEGLIWLALVRGRWWFINGLKPPVGNFDEGRAPEGYDNYGAKDRSGGAQAPCVFVHTGRKWGLLGNPPRVFFWNCFSQSCVRNACWRNICDGWVDWWQLCLDISYHVAPMPLSPSCISYTWIYLIYVSCMIYVYILYHLIITHTCVIQ